MSSTSPKNGCDRVEEVLLHVLQAHPAADVPAIKSHIAGCPECRQELETARSIVDAWPTDVLRPSTSLWGRVAERIGTVPDAVPAAQSEWTEPEWQEAAPGISCKLLATDTERDRVSMLVRLGPGVDYPPHRHAGVEELHLLEGELVVDEKTLYPGDYIRAEAGSADARVWSGTGCTCVLITSPSDELR